MSTRTTDRLVGAGVTLLVLLLLVAAVVVAFFVWVGEPADEARPSPAEESEAATGDAPPPPEDLEEGETWLADIVLESSSLLTPDARLTDVRAVGVDVRSGPDGTVAGELDVEATVPFEVVAGEIAADVVVRAGDDGEVAVEREVVLAGRVFLIVASGTVEVVSGRLVVEPQTVDIGGPDFLSQTIGDIVRELVTIEHTVQGLPEGLVLQQVIVEDDGFRADLSGQDVVLGDGSGG